jgi:predicted dehydrogenase
VATQPIRLGLIGLGQVAQINHLPAIRKRRDVTLAAICDDDVGKARELAHRYGVPRAFSDFEELLRVSDLDAVVVSTPNHLHAPMTLAALDYGKHVLCEKPPARTAAEAQQMADAAGRTNKILMYAMNNRFRSDVRILRRFIEKRDLGEIFYAKTGWLRRRGERRGAEWYSNKRSSGGGVLMDLGVQMLDLSLWLMGSPRVVSVTATKYVQDPRRDVEDTLAAMLVLEGRACLTVEVSWALLLEKNFAYLNLYGTEGAALLNPFRIHKEMHGNLMNVTPALESDRDNYKVSYELEMDHFLRCITHGEKPLASAEEGLALMRVIDAIYESADARREVRLH